MIEIRIPKNICLDILLFEHSDLFRQDSPEIDAHGKESMNFQISMLIWNAIALILCLVLIGIPILILLHILNIIFVIVASIQASEAKLYRYPLAIRLIT